jgi:hypothetical protein
MAQSIHSLHIECLGLYTLGEGTIALREGIAECCEPAVFKKSIKRVQSLAMSGVDGLLSILPHAAELERAGVGRFLNEIILRFLDDNDRSPFGWMNAITATARDARNQDDRWRLEELGGGVGARILPKRPSRAPGQELTAQLHVPVA